MDIDFEKEIKKIYDEKLNKLISKDFQSSDIEAVIKKNFQHGITILIQTYIELSLTCNCLKQLKNKKRIYPSLSTETRNKINEQIQIIQFIHNSIYNLINTTSKMTELLNKH